MPLDATHTFEVGLENAPDSRWGMDRLTVEPDGRFSYENRQSGHLLKVSTGSIETSVVHEMARALEDAGFPTVPEHAKPPGGDYVRIVAGAREAFMVGYTAESFRGYGPLLARLRAWAKYLRGDGGTEAPSGLRVDAADR